MLSSSPRIFVTGVSGYIGGHTVSLLTQRHPEYTITLLVRDDLQKLKVQTRWPDVEIVVGDLDSSELLIKEASKSDVVLQLASADHAPGVMNLIRGCAERKGGPAYYVHVSGTGMLHDVADGYGEMSPKIYHDVDDVAEITTLSLEGHLHRDIDNVVLSTGADLKVPTAIISPPMIYGIGAGPIKTRSIQVPILTEAILKRGHGFQILNGQNFWDHIHIDDIAEAFILLIEEALKPHGGSASWGIEGYYFAEAGEFTWTSAASKITSTAYSLGYLTSSNVEKLTVAEASIIHPWAPIIWGGNCRSRAQRLRSMGWVPKGVSFESSLTAIIEAEMKELSIVKGKTTFEL